MTHFITDIESQTVTLDGRTYTAADCRHRLYEDFCRRYGPDSFHACLAAFLREWFDASDTVCVHTSGSTGTPKELRVEKRRMMASAMMTVDFLGLRRGDAALLCMPLQYIAGKMVVVRALVSGLNLLPVTPSGHPLKALHEAPAFAAMIPMQVFNALQVPAERALLKDIRQLIIGGGSIDASMSEALQDFPHAVWSTYGMTETLSHIAMRRLNGPQASAWYTPFPGVHISTSPEGTLAIHAPAVNPDLLVTNDLVEFDAQGRREGANRAGGRCPAPPPAFPLRHHLRARCQVWRTHRAAGGECSRRASAPAPRHRCPAPVLAAQAGLQRSAIAQNGDRKAGQGYGTEAGCAVIIRAGGRLF